MVHGSLISFRDDGKIAGLDRVEEAAAGDVGRGKHDGEPESSRRTMRSDLLPKRNYFPVYTPLAAS